MTHPPAPRDIDPHQAYAAHNTGTHLLLDVRTVEEWQRDHAPAATHMPLDELAPERLDPTVPVIAVCRSGGRSSKAARRLADAGFTMKNMAGGMQLWEQLGLPVEGPDGEAGLVA